MKYILPISFGADSMAMADKLLSSGRQIDYVIFYDTLMEFDTMYQYKEKVEAYFKARYNIEIIVLKPMTTFEEWCFGVIRDKNAEFYGYIRGIPCDMMGGVCYWKRESKVKPFDNWAKENLDDDFVVYIGYTNEEQSRKYKNDVVEVKNNNGKTLIQTFEYPLMYDFNMSSVDCRMHLINREMENPLYKLFTRTGCATCHNQSDRSWLAVWENYPDVWEYMEWIEKRLYRYEEMGMKVVNKNWFTKRRTCYDMVREFEFKKDTLFNFSDEPVKDCFCAI